MSNPLLISAEELYIESKRNQLNHVRPFGTLTQIERVTLELYAESANNLVTAKRCKIMHDRQSEKWNKGEK